MAGSGARQTILVVDDDDDIRDLLANLLRRAGYRTIEASTGQEGLRRLFEDRPALVILDVMLPYLDGWRTLERIRDISDVPVLMLTARGAELERVRGLRGGADDYVAKPFGRQELLARIDALLRRAGGSDAEREVYADELVRVDFPQRQVAVAGRPVSLSALEFRLLATFVRHPDRVLTHEYLLDAVWGARAATKNELKLYVSYLRRKLFGKTAGSPIETVRGFGYRYRSARS
ncbi:MAG TPA: response regulator transcription factor [Gaiellaceae bacterium]|nr:response regulator transcription factor [Gaiellaceae bacterium]